MRTPRSKSATAISRWWFQGSSCVKEQGKTLTLVGELSSQNLYVNGAVHIQPGATLNNGQIRFQIMGNWSDGSRRPAQLERTAGCFSAVFKRGTISSTSGTETFECPAIDKTGGSLILASAPATNVTFSSCGTSVWSFSQGTLDLNGRMLTLTGSGTDVLHGMGTLAVTGGTAAGGDEHQQGLLLV